MKNCSLIDNDTGEVYNDNFKMMEIEDTLRMQKSVEIRQSKEDGARYIKENLGDFYFLFYKLINKGIPRQYIMRFLYLCCYMDYENNLIFGNQKNDGKYMIDKDLQEVLKLSQREVDRTKECLFKNNLLLKNSNDKLTINDKYCFKGKLEGNQKTSSRVRMFENGIKELYEKSKPTEHKKLTLLIELLPHINMKHNIICQNPKCKINAEIMPLSIKEICEVVNYSKNQSSRLKKDLLKLRVSGEMAVKYTETDEAKFFTINPRVYYKGSINKDTIPFIKGIMKDFENKGGI